MQHGLRKFFWLMGAFTITFVSLASQAKADPLSPSYDNLVILEHRIADQPHNLDYYFEYAQMATVLEEFNRAKRAYKAMLKANPSLDRVRLDLALLSIQTGEYAEGKKLLETVLSHNPPEEVVTNIQQLLAVAEKSLKTHSFYAGATVGYSYDTNANSASSTDQVKVGGISVPLTADSQEDDDTQMIASAVVGHSYRIAELDTPEYGLRWNTNLIVYGTQQTNLDELDLGLLSGKTGPTLQLKELKTSIGLNGSYSYITLDGNEYLGIPQGELVVDYTPTSRLLLSLQGTFEHRHFVNSPTVFTYTDRTGNAWQSKLGAKYLLTQNDILSGSFAYREEGTRQEYYDNHYIEVAGGYIRVLPWDSFLSLSSAYQWVEYDGIDSFIDPSTIREDENWTNDISIGKKLALGLTMSLGYQYKHVDSNIENYAYDNHRVMTTLGWQYQ
ncbi:MAG: tetratricopeptide-repeat containing protein [Rickettsiales bacterium]|jgi:tetratricopeptide (TPR) repeat protein|nr:tetratricopeptide-repeat containing protein [Rickettsiales bacterium]